MNNTKDIQVVVVPVEKSLSIISQLQKSVFEYFHEDKKKFTAVTKLCSQISLLGGHLGSFGFIQMRDIFMNVCPIEASDELKKQISNSDDYIKSLREQINNADTVMDLINIKNILTPELLKKVDEGIAAFKENLNANINKLGQAYSDLNEMLQEVYEAKIKDEKKKINNLKIEKNELKITISELESRKDKLEIMRTESETVIQKLEEFKNRLKVKLLNADGEEIKWEKKLLQAEYRLLEEKKNLLRIDTELISINQDLNEKADKLTSINQNLNKKMDELNKNNKLYQFDIGKENERGEFIYDSKKLNILTINHLYDSLSIVANYELDNHGLDNAKKQVSVDNKYKRSITDIDNPEYQKKLKNLVEAIQDLKQRERYLYGDIVNPDEEVGKESLKNFSESLLNYKIAFEEILNNSALFQIFVHQAEEIRAEKSEAQIDVIGDIIRIPALQKALEAYSITHHKGLEKTINEFSIDKEQLASKGIKKDTTLKKSDGDFGIG